MPTRRYEDVVAKHRKSLTPEGRVQAEIFNAGAKLAGDVLRLRKARGLSQVQLAEITGIDQGDISRIERGLSNATEVTYEKIAAALGGEMRMVEREAALA